MQKYKLRLFFEWGGPCLWAMNEEAKEHFGGYSGAEETLPLTRATKAKLEQLNELHDTALNRDDPAGPSLWTQADYAKFTEEVRSVLKVIKSELGPDFFVYYEP